MIILASSSSRRKEILASILGSDSFITINPDCDETAINFKNVKEENREKAIAKGKSIQNQISINDYIISSDTMVYFKKNKIGKPINKEDSIRLLNLLNGKIHEVITSYAIFNKEKMLILKTCVSLVKIKKMSEYDIEKYVDSGLTMDKAGAYGIQDKEYINCKLLKGDYYTVMGLPKKELKKDLIKLKIINYDRN